MAQSEQNLTPEAAQLATGVPPPQHKILFPVDFTGRSTEAVGRVLFWANRFGITIFVSHVMDPVASMGQQRSP